MKRKEKREKRTESEEETMNFAAEFARTLRGGEVILLIGELGAGKTTFVRGLAQAFGIREPIRSPTFTLMHIHKIIKSKNQKIKKLVHIDAYRLRGAADLRALGLEEYLGKKDTVVVIEWGEKARGIRSSARQFYIVFTSESINKRSIKIKRI